MKMIACIQEDGGLGYKGDLLYFFKEDLEHFKKTTLDSAIVMGYNTWVSLPNKPLPKRDNIVLCSNNEQVEMVSGTGAIFLRNIDNLAQLEKDLGKEVYIIGGGFVYKQTINLCEKIILTEVRGQNKLADTFFPLDKLTENFKKITERKLLEGVYIVEYERK